MIEIDLPAVLNTLPDVNALVGTRIWPLVLPTEPILPAITYQIVGGKTTPTFGTGGVTRARVQFDCWGSSYGDATTLRTALIKNLNGLQAGTFTALLIQVIDDSDHELLQYRAVAEFYIFFQQ